MRLFDVFSYNDDRLVTESLNVQQLAAKSDEALDNAYHYGRSTPGNTFGWQANLASAAYAKEIIDSGETDINKISDAVHKGWWSVAQKFVDDPDQFSDTEALRAKGKFDKKMADRIAQMVPFNQLTPDQQKIDRVVAEALLQAITGGGEQGVAEGNFGPAATTAIQQGKSPSDVAYADTKDINNIAKGLKIQQQVAAGDDPTLTNAGNAARRAGNTAVEDKQDMAEGHPINGVSGLNVYGDLVYAVDSPNGKAGTKVGEFRGYDHFVLDWTFEKALKARGQYDNNEVQEWIQTSIPTQIKNGRMKIVPSTAPGVARKDPSQNFGQQGVAEGTGQVEAYGYRYNNRDQRVVWRKNFPSSEAAYAWADKHNATVIGVRAAEKAVDKSLNEFAPGDGGDEKQYLLQLADELANAMYGPNKSALATKDIKNKIIAAGGDVKISHNNDTTFNVVMYHPTYFKQGHLIKLVGNEDPMDEAFSLPTMEGIKNWLLKFKQGLGQEADESKEMLDVYARYTQGFPVNDQEMAVANEQLKDVARGIGMGIFAAIPGHVITVPILFGLAKKFNIQLLPSAFNSPNQQGVAEGWKDKLAGAALAGSMALGGGAHAGGWEPSDVPAGGHNQLPDIVAHVTFKVGDREVSKEINLGSHYRSPGEAGEELKNFLQSKGIKYYQYSLERVKPKADYRIDSSPATSGMTGGMDTGEPAAAGPTKNNYMAKDVNEAFRLGNKRLGNKRDRFKSIHRPSLVETEPTHRIGVTVTDPNHPMVSKRGETIQKSIRVTHADRDAAINRAIAHYRKKGYKVHDHHYMGTVEPGVAEGILGSDPNRGQKVPGWAKGGIIGKIGRKLDPAWSDIQMTVPQHLLSKQSSVPATNSPATKDMPKVKATSITPTRAIPKRAGTNPSHSVPKNVVKTIADKQGVAEGMRKWLVIHSGSHGEGGKMTIEAPDFDTAWKLANEYDLDIIEIKPVKGVAEAQLNELDMWAPVTTFIKMTDGSYVQADWRRNQSVTNGFRDSASFVNFKPVNPTVVKQLGLDSHQSNNSISNPRTGTIATGGDYQGSGPLANRRYDVVDYNKPETMEELPPEIKSELVKWVQKQGVAEGQEQTPDQVRQTLNAWMNKDQQFKNPTQRAGFQAQVWPYIQQNIKTIFADKGADGKGSYPAAPYAAWLLVQHMDATPNNQSKFASQLEQTGLDPTDGKDGEGKLQFIKDRAAVNQWILKLNDPEKYLDKHGKPLNNPTVDVRDPNKFDDAGIVSTSRQQALEKAIEAGNTLLVAAVQAAKAQTQPSYKQGVAEAGTSAAVRLGRAIARTQGKTAASQARSVIPSSIPKKEEPKQDEKKVDEGIQAGDGFIIECGDSAIETVVLGDYLDGILIEFDHTATFMLIDAGITLTEAEYHGRTVPLGKRMAGDVKKSKVYVKKPNGNVVKVNFGDKNMTIKKHLPKHRKSYRARHHCENPGPKWKANYWSCRAW